MLSIIQELNALKMQIKYAEEWIDKAKQSVYLIQDELTLLEVKNARK